MIKRVKELNPNALIASEKFRSFAEKFGSDLVRGINKLVVLAIIRQAGNEGIHGYKILRELEMQTKETLLIDEGVLYPLLTRLKDEGLITQIKKEEEGRKRTFYALNNDGENMYNYMVGFYTKLTEVIAPIFDVGVNLKLEKYYFCPLCANKIDLSNNEKFCSVCGNNIIEEIKKRRENK